ncbi:DinB family protein [Alicyclobacillus curvatus]|nr:DinB family protein [Alicyclobacillus curvatus]
MEKLFRYNWQVRDDWFTWCEDVPEEELLRRRVGGRGSILYTLFHVVQEERSWIHFLKTQQDFAEPSFDEYASLEEVKALSNQYHKEVETFVVSWVDEMEIRSITATNSDGQSAVFRHGEIMRHLIAHEIHHVGQLSVWARELGRKPVTSNFIFRRLF